MRHLPVQGPSLPRPYYAAGLNLKRFVIASPGGNTTALIFDPVDERLHAFINAVIERKYSHVEQVLFVQKRNDGMHGQMAGGEFCGNAARALGYLLTEGREGSASFTMSGLSHPVTVETANEQSRLKMQIEVIPETKFLGQHPVTVMHMEGISHALFYPDSRSFPNDTLLNQLNTSTALAEDGRQIHCILKELGLETKLASGLVFVRAGSHCATIRPHVYVKGVKTLYAETACATASIAVAFEAMRNEKHDRISKFIKQPNGKTFHIDLRNSEKYLYAEVAGSIKVLYDGAASFPLTPSPASHRLNSICYG